MNPTIALLLLVKDSSPLVAFCQYKCVAFGSLIEQHRS